MEYQSFVFGNTTKQCDGPQLCLGIHQIITMHLQCLRFRLEEMPYQQQLFHIKNIHLGKFQMKLL